MGTRTETYETVRQALMLRRHVIGIYQGLVRKMCPHVIGTKMGRERALVYQFGGQSRTGLGPPGSLENFRCLDLADLQVLEVRDGRWHTAADGLWTKHAQGCVDWIDIQSF